MYSANAVMAIGCLKKKHKTGSMRIKQTQGDKVRLRVAVDTAALNPVFIQVSVSNSPSEMKSVEAVA